MLKPKLDSEQGFTLIEVLAAILIMTLFIATTMQMLAIAAVFKVRAKQSGEATALIQQDIESVKAKAITIKNTTLSAVAAPGDASITIVPNTTFAVNDKLRIGSDFQGYSITSISGNTINVSPSIKITNVTNVSIGKAAGVSVIPVDSVLGFSVGDTIKIDSNTYTITSIDTSVSPKTFTVNPPLAANVIQTAMVQLVQPAGAIVSAINSCPTLTTAPTLATGFGSLVQASLPAQVTSPNYTITRTSAVKNVSPYEIVELNYTVTPVAASNTGVNTLAKINAEVVADAALKCP
jgi:prepilin-type N-terminal cleavage/methylation domain-containing protein